MSHTCSFCGHRSVRFVPSKDGAWEKERSMRKIASNCHYHHDNKTWKNKKAKKQYAKF